MAAPQAGLSDTTVVATTLKQKKARTLGKKEKLLYIESLHLEHSCGRSKTSGINFSLCLQVQTYFSQRKGPGCGCYIS